LSNITINNTIVQNYGRSRASWGRRQNRKMLHVEVGQYRICVSGKDALLPCGLNPDGYYLSRFDAQAALNKHRETYPHLEDENQYSLQLTVVVV